MKRRGFLGLLAGAAVAPFVPTPKVQPSFPRKIAPKMPDGWVWSNSEACYREPLTMDPAYHYRLAAGLNAMRVGTIVTVKLPQRYQR